MIAEVDTHMMGRLNRILFNRTPVTAYPYIPNRDKKKTVWPNVGLQRQDIIPDQERARPNCEIWEPVGEVTVNVPRLMGGGTETGPDAWNKYEYPVPVSLLYEVQAQATVPEHNTALLEKILQVLPIGYSPVIDGQSPTFVHGRPINMDNLDDSIFAISFLITVGQLWIPRLEVEHYRSIQTFGFDVLA